jgi:hypothetical protein
MDATPAVTAQTQPAAVVWIDERHAIIARCEPEGQISTVDVRRLARPEARFLTQVVHEIVGRGPVMVIGTQPIRLALERRYVAVSHRPDRLVAPPPQAAASDAEIVRGLGRRAA